MKISGSGCARWGMQSIKERKGLFHAKMAISCLHDALLAVAKGMLSPEEIKDFFWENDLDRATFFGDVLVLSDKEKKDKPLFYLQDTRQYVGNCMMWWKHDNCGYVTNIKEAKVWTQAELDAQDPSDHFRKWPKEYIDQRTKPTIDCQYCDYDFAFGNGETV